MIKIINAREYTLERSLTEELSFDPNKNALFDLAYLQGVQLIGEKSAEFLQGQVTCDVRKVTPNHIQQGALCNLKGRILALFDITLSQNFGFCLILPTDMVSDTCNVLQKTAMFSRVKVNPSNDFSILGLYLKNNDSLVPNQNLLNLPHYQSLEVDNTFYYHLDDGFYIILCNEERTEVLKHTFQQNNRLFGSLAWHQQQLLRSQYQIYPQSRGLFLPHRLGLQKTDYLSFGKGCYKGQEIIARTQFRAKLKHEMKLFTITTPHALFSGQKVFDAAGIEVGEVIDLCPLTENTLLVAISISLTHPKDLKFEGNDKLISCNPLVCKQEG